jgi:hypothetical protein
MSSNKPRPAFLKIAKGLNEALTVARGETEPARVHLVEPGRDSPNPAVAGSFKQLSAVSEWKFGLEVSR